MISSSVNRDFRMRASAEMRRDTVTVPEPWDGGIVADATALFSTHFLPAPFSS
jgi:hypothetical protein